MLLAPAERYEVIVDFAQYPIGTSVVLKNLQGGDRTTNVMRFDVVRDAVDTSTGAGPPADNSKDPGGAGDVRRRFVFERDNGQWVINGKTFDPNRIDAQPRVGDTEVWTLENKSGGWLHPIHIHLTNFQVLDRNGRPPLAQESGWKETSRSAQRGGSRDHDVAAHPRHGGSPSTASATRTCSMPQPGARGSRHMMQVQVVG